MKKLISIILTFCIFTGLFSAVTFTSGAAEVSVSSVEATSGNYSYDILEDGTVKITNYTGSETDVVIPSVIDGRTVTVLGRASMDNNDSFRSVVIPDTVKIIEQWALSWCLNLERLTIGNGVTTISDRAFAWSGMTDVVIGNNVSYIGEKAFLACNNLTNVTMGRNVQYIGYEAFYSGQKLTNVYFGGTKEQWRSLDVYHNESIKYATIHCVDGDIVSIPFNNYRYSPMDNAACELLDYCGSDKDIVVPSTFVGLPVTSIRNGAFWICTGLRSIKLPDGIKYIGECAFSCADKLESITLPDSVEYIGRMSFIWCEKLTEIKLPKSMTAINESTFKNCKSLKTVTIPVGIVSVGNDAFGECDSLADVYYGGTMAQWKSISMGSNNKSLTNATIHCKDGVINKTSVTLKKSSATIYRKGKTTIKAIVAHGHGNTTYKSKNTKIAKANSKGVVIGVKKGKTKITVTNHGVKKTFTVTVKNPTLNKKNVSLNKGKTFTLKIKGNVGKATFKTKNKNIANVNAKGKIKGKKAGNTVITVKTNGITLKCKVKVK